VTALAGLLAPLAVGLLAGCDLVAVDSPDPAAIPSGSIQPEAGVATGPAVEVGSGVASGIGWRFAVFPSEDGWCTQLETVAVTTTGCGDLEPAAGQAFGSVGESGRIVDGIVTEEAATVWVIADGGGRLPATLMPLDEAGLEGLAFVGILPADAVPTHVMAVKFNGDVLETYELP
jgi:hypothetical protein